MIPSILAESNGIEEINKATGDPLLTLFGGLVLIILVFWYFSSDRDRIRRNVGSVIMLSTVVFSFFAIASPTGWMKIVTGERSFGDVSKLRRGIDIAGGASFTLQVNQVNDEAPVTAESLNEVKAVLEKRLASKFPEIGITIQPNVKRIEVQIPDVTDAEAIEIRGKLQQVATLEIYKTHLERTRFINSRPAEYLDPDTGEVDYKRYEETLESGSVFPSRMVDRNGEVREGFIVTTDHRPVLDGQDVQNAYPDRTSGTRIVVRLTREGGVKNEQFTSQEMIKDRDQIAIVFDGVCISNPVQNADRLGRDFVITGMKNIEEGKRLSANLTNPLKNKPTIIRESKVSATLGDETINQGLRAGVIGLGLTLVFVLLYYRLAGLIALIGLSVNILVVFGSMALMSATFTLPGIAGVILTIGVAVDANVLIYERLREERESGKPFGEALRVAYEKAFSAIIDANVTTLITAVILFAMATGSVKGFAVTLTIGILGTLLAALVFTRTMFWLGRDLGLVKEARFLNLIPKRTIDFMSKGKATLALSALLVIVAFGFILGQGKNTLGVDFTGGSSLEYAVANEDIEGKEHLSQTSIQTALDKLSLKQKAKVQIVSPAGGDNKIVSIKLSDQTSEQEMVDKLFRGLDPVLSETLKTGGDDEKFKVPRSAEGISASMGAEFLNNSLVALGVGLICILFYITLRFEFSFAVGAFFALAHDIILVLGVLVISGAELSMIHVGAFLTIAGYSINDTIVVFDRIRENLKYSESSITSVMNTAISATLSRTILTSVTTFVAVLVLFIFGGSALSDFSFTIMIGVIVGTYSSIFVASPIVWLFSKLRGNDLREEVISAQMKGEEEEFETEKGGDPEPA